MGTSKSSNKTETLKVGYATYPSVKLMNNKVNPKTKKKTFGMTKELIFGDFIKPYLVAGKYETKTVGEKTYIKVRARNADGYILPNQIQKERILEVNFVDVGQGDGCHLVTPSDEHFIIDAGPADNMFRFLKWRFNLENAKNSPPPFDIVISHSDADHYKGFNKIFPPVTGRKNQFTIKNIYHNGLIEQSGSNIDTLGKVVSHEGADYIETIETNAAAQKLIKSVAKPGEYLKTLSLAEGAKIQALTRNSVLDKSILYQKNKLTIEVLGPFTQKVNGKNALPVFGANKGKTKNGNSVILLLSYGNFKALLGGDLNQLAEDYIITQYSGEPIADIKRQLEQKSISTTKRKNLEQQLDSAIQKARKHFEVDVAKSCHHGSGDFTTEFLRALNATATIVSSGDDEPHCHPRPNTLGTIGKHSHGKQSLIFCTELARSGKEYIDLTKVAPSKKKERVVTVYGMINLRTDGEKAIIAQKLERPAPRGNWDIHKLEWDSNTSKFEYKSK